MSREPALGPDEKLLFRVERNLKPFHITTVVLVFIVFAIDVSAGTFPAITFVFTVPVAIMLWVSQNRGTFVTTKRVVQHRLLGERGLNLNLIGGVDRQWGLWGHTVVFKGSASNDKVVATLVKDAPSVVARVSDLLHQPNRNVAVAMPVPVTDPHQVLRARLASGEISEEEYARKRELLR